MNLETYLRIVYLISEEQTNKQNLTGRQTGDLCRFPKEGNAFKLEVEVVVWFSNGDPQATAWPWRERTRE